MQLRFPREQRGPRVGLLAQLFSQVSERGEKVRIPRDVGFFFFFQSPPVGTFRNAPRWSRLVRICLFLSISLDTTPKCTDNLRKNEALKLNTDSETLAHWRPTKKDTQKTRPYIDGNHSNYTSQLRTNSEPPHYPYTHFSEPRTAHARHPRARTVHRNR